MAFGIRTGFALGPGTDWPEMAQRSDPHPPLRRIRRIDSLEVEWPGSVDWTASGRLDRVRIRPARRPGGRDPPEETST